MILTTANFIDFLKKKIRPLSFFNANFYFADSTLVLDTDRDTFNAVFDQLSTSTFLFENGYTLDIHQSKFSNDEAVFIFNKLSNLPEIYIKHDTLKLKKWLSFHVNHRLVYIRCLKDQALNQHGKKELLHSAKSHKYGLEIGNDWSVTQ